MPPANLDPVQQQYERWTYPPAPVDLDVPWVDQVYQTYDWRQAPSSYWPNGRVPAGLSILVAGCGTVQAAYHARTNPDATVVGIDLSASSLAHERYLQQKHGLSNLTLHQMSLTDAAELGRTFDIIVSTGVLHHLPDPEAGLRALRDVLRPDGTMLLMLYGRYARVGVYMLQDAFRRVGLDQSAESVATVRAVLENLPPWHSARFYAENAFDLAADGGVVDTFLHPQDRAYSVDEVFAFLENNQMKFAGWSDNLNYTPHVPDFQRQPIYPRLLALPERQQWAVTELLGQGRGTHIFRACHAGKELFRISFDGLEFLNYIPSRHPGLQAGPGDDQMLRIERREQSVQLSGLAREYFELSDGTRRIADIIAAAQLHDAVAARRFFGMMFELGHMLFTVNGAAK